MVAFAVAAVAFCDVVLLNGPFSQACENRVSGTQSKSVTENQLDTSKHTNSPTTNEEFEIQAFLNVFHSYKNES